MKVILKLVTLTILHGKEICMLYNISNKEVLEGITDTIEELIKSIANVKDTSWITVHLLDNYIEGENLYICYSCMLPSIIITSELFNIMGTINDENSTEDYKLLQKASSRAY